MLVSSSMSFVKSLAQQALATCLSISIINVESGEEHEWRYKAGGLDVTYARPQDSNYADTL